MRKSCKISGQGYKNDLEAGKGWSVIARGYKQIAILSANQGGQGYIMHLGASKIISGAPKPYSAAWATGGDINIVRTGSGQ